MSGPVKIGKKRQDDRMIFKNLWRRKTRTLLTLLGIAVGVAAVVSLSAFGEGLASGFEKTFSSSSADLTVGQKSAMMLFLSAVDESVGDEIQQIPGVEQVSGTVAGVMQLPEAPYFIVLGEDPRGFNMAHYRLIAGTLPAEHYQIIIGKTTAENFKKKPGDPFILNDLTFRVSGVYETGVGLEDGGAVMRLEDAQRIFNKRRQVSYFAVQVRDARRIDDIKQAIETRWEDLAATRSGEATQQEDALNIYRSMGWFIGIFAVMVGGLGMMNTTLMSVFERTREIGVLRAVGWSRGRVMRMIMGESLLLAALGGLTGIGLGVGLTLLAQTVPSVASMLSGVFTPELFLQAMVIALLLGTAGGVYPAWRAAQLAPVEAMRAESGSITHVNRLTRFLARGALRNLFRRPVRTFITVLGLGIGVGFIVALIAMVDGFVVSFNQMTGAGQVDLLAEQSKTSDLSLSEIDERTALSVRSMSEVASISKILVGISTAPGLPYFMVYGLDPTEDYIRHFRVREGHMVERPGDIIIGRFAANSLKKTVGETLRFSGSGFRIVGIYENGSAYEDAGGLVLLHDAQQLFNKPRKISLLGIQLKDEYRGQAKEIAAQITRVESDLTVSVSTGFVEQMQDMASTYAMLNTLIALTVVVGGIVMMNAMLMSVFERTQEIGVLRALGWRRRQVLSMVLVESLALSLLSALAGIGLGIGLNYLISREPSLGVFLTPAYSPQLFLEILALAVFLGMIGGLYPAWRASNLRPIEALRYE
jgi:ABC-type antimicrobial peptide transport system permease subunit